MGAALKVFVSYSVRDHEMVDRLQADIAGLGHEVWRDTNLVGGQTWWDVICAEIRAADVFVFVVSTTSVRSRYCLAELGYAVSVGCHLLPVKIVEAKNDALPAAVRNRHWVDYRDRSADAAFALGRSFEQLASAPQTRPDARPVAPPVPVEDLLALRDRAMAPALTFEQQRSIVREIADRFEGCEDILADVVRQMRDRDDLTEHAAQDLDELIDRVPDRSTSGTAGRNLLRGLITFIESQRFTPILGTGVTDSLVGSRRQLAREFASSFEFPMSPHLRDDLPQVAQYVNVMAGEETLRATLHRQMAVQLYTAVDSTTPPPPPSVTRGLALDTLFAEVWDGRSKERPDPHAVLAELPCPIYVTAHPAQLLEHALRAAGKDPVSDMCRWRRDVDEWPESPLGSLTEPRYIPTVEQPLVFHVFGRLDHPQSLVLTEDDYFEFLIGVSEDRELIPPVVKRALVDSALLLLGFRLDDWDSRTLWRALVRQEGGARRKHYKHVAAQVDLAGTVVAPDDARLYLSEYFGKLSHPPLDIFWGRVDELTTLLHNLWVSRS